MTCDNCGAQRGADDVFCESCGLDFLSGSLPESEAAGGNSEALEEAGDSTISGSASSSPDSAKTVESSAVGTVDPAASGVKLHLTIEADRAQFDKVVKEAEVDFPDPAPPLQTLELAGTEFHIGRTSQSRAIHPDLDIYELTGDEAVSSRHAVIKVADDASVTITDVGSTNGTAVGVVDEKLIAAGKPVSIEPGSAIFLGAWTKLTILEATT